MQRGLVLAIAAVLLLSGCANNSGDPNATPTATVTVTETAPLIEPEPEPTPTEAADTYAPNIGDRALTVGDTRVGRDVLTTLTSVKYPYPPAYAREPDPGNDFVGLELEQCFGKDVETDPDFPAQTTYNSEWVALDPQGYEYGGDGSSWNDWPTPKFPELVTMNSGRCYKGWIAIQAPKGTRIASVIWRPDGTETAEWLPKN
ncbi:MULTISPECIES: hypothetical protein [unclassified Nocardioides]|uniref:hypothetical protein n=1 Tax=unclassified Nocardioides TaxID=2615069 RepID=UPI0010554E4D|nr:MULTISPECIES: hypothetical protein [unclassified Nocardioides]